MAHSSALPGGTLLGDRYELDTLIGHGGFGNLYRAIDVESRQQIAVRVFASDLAADTAFLTRLKKQIATIAALHHHNITAILDHGLDGATPFIVTEWIDGLSLRQMISRKRNDSAKFSTKGIYNLLAHLCNALDYAHRVTTHGLPGPGSVFVSESGRVKLTDFGLIPAALAHPELIERLGDAYALAPEMRGAPAMELNAAADVYSLGVMLHELVTLQRPSDHLNLALIGADLAPIIRMCLERSPQRRYPSVQALKSALKLVLAQHDEGGPHAAADPSSAQHDVVSARPQPQARAHATPAPVAAAPPPAAVAPHPVAVAMATPTERVPTIQELLATPDEDPREKWLVRKGNLDFGPFAISDVKRRLFQRELNPDDQLIDPGSGASQSLRVHPLTRAFIVHLDQHRAHEALRQEQAKRQRYKTVYIVTGLALVALIVGAGIVSLVLVLRKKDAPVAAAATREEKPKETAADVSRVEFVLKVDPPPPPSVSRKKSRRHRSRHSNKRMDDDLSMTNLGDASEEGGDERLSKEAIQTAMGPNMKPLGICVIDEARRDPELPEVTMIDFAVRGTGRVSAVRVNGEMDGPLYDCVAQRMQTILFPSFDGTVTKASFAIHITR